MMKDSNPQIKDIKRISSNIYIYKKKSPKHFLIKLQNTKKKRKSRSKHKGERERVWLLSKKQEWQVTYHHQREARKEENEVLGEYNSNISDKYNDLNRGRLEFKVLELSHGAIMPWFQPKSTKYGIYWWRKEGWWLSSLAIRLTLHLFSFPQD